MKKLVLKRNKHRSSETGNVLYGAWKVKHKGWTIHFEDSMTLGEVAEVLDSHDPYAATKAKMSPANA